MIVLDAQALEAFFTGGGLHTFGNFDREDDRRIMTVREAFQQSVNLVFIRLMRDLVWTHLYGSPGSLALLMDNPGDPRRDRYLSRFADREGHQVFLEPEGLDTHLVYPNGISTSLPADVQEQIVRRIPGLENAEILRHGYAVEYDMVWPTQIRSTLETKTIAGLFLAGQINGTSGYEEAAAQGQLAGINAARYAAAGVADRVCSRWSLAVRFPRSPTTGWSSSPKTRSSAP